MQQTQTHPAQAFVDQQLRRMQESRVSYGLLSDMPCLSIDQLNIDQEYRFFTICIREINNIVVRITSYRTESARSFISYLGRNITTLNNIPHCMLIFGLANAAHREVHHGARLLGIQINIQGEIHNFSPLS